MAETQRSYLELIALLADNTTGAISEQDLRDVVESLMPPCGQISTSTNATATTITDTSSWFPVSYSSTAFSSVNHLFDSPDTGQLRYIGASPRMVHIAVSVSFTSAANNQEIQVALAKNGTETTEAQAHRKIGTGADIGSTSFHWITNMVTNDIFSLAVKNATSASNVTIKVMNIQAVGMLM